MLKKRKVAGIKGKMSLRAMETQAVDGQSVQLDGGYNKQGKGRIALAASLAAIVFLPAIFIPGGPAELPEGTVFDAMVATPITIAAQGRTTTPRIDLSGPDTRLEVTLLYEELENQEKPKWFHFQIIAPKGASDELMIDRINGEEVAPLSMRNLSDNQIDDRKVVVAGVKIKKLTKRFRKGLNTIQVSTTTATGERLSDEILVEIEI